MEKERLLAFTDGVIAVIITIMVLEMKVPQDASLGALAAVTPVFLSYVLSFAYVSIYWNNHHHFFHLGERHDAVGQHRPVVLAVAHSVRHRLDGGEPFCPGPDRPIRRRPAHAGARRYGLQLVIIRAQGRDSALARAIGRDLKGKVSPVLYIAGILLAFVDARIACAIYLLVALLWLIPDRRIERVVRRL
jgi:uncharacterized membrane protein